MELTKEQVEKVENYLIKSGVNYWDIRVELLDHLVTHIESRFGEGKNFDRQMEESIALLGLDGDLTQLTKSRLHTINKIARKRFFRSVRASFSSAKSLFFMLLFTGIYYLSLLFFNAKTFGITTAVLLLIPAVVGLVFYSSEMLRSKRSGYLIYTSFYIFFPLLLLNVFIQFVKPDGIIPVSSDIQKKVWFVVTVLNSICSIAAIVEHSKAMKKVTVMRANLYK